MTGRILKIFQIIVLIIERVSIFFLSCLGEFKTAMGGTICKCRTAKITRCENNTVHSRFLQIF